MKLSEEQLQKMLDDSLPSIVESFKAELKSGIDYQVRENAGRQVAEFVKGWVQTNVIPELEKQLVESKAGLIDAGPVLAAALVDQMRVAITATVADKLKESWGRREFFKALLG